MAGRILPPGYRLTYVACKYNAFGGRSGEAASAALRGWGRHSLRTMAAISLLYSQRALQPEANNGLASGALYRNGQPVGATPPIGARAARRGADAGSGGPDGADCGPAGGG